jgi:hypothetical protein
MSLPFVRKVAAFTGCMIIMQLMSRIAMPDVGHCKHVCSLWDEVSQFIRCSIREQRGQTIGTDKVRIVQLKLVSSVVHLLHKCRNRATHRISNSNSSIIEL